MMLLPPLTALRAFEAAARHLSFTRAAEELAMSQAAVSYQIKTLEARVGAPLFQRHGRTITLTEVGRALSISATDGFRALAEGYAGAQDGGLGTLSINAIPSFAANWLAVNIGEFQTLHPKLSIDVDAQMRTVDLAESNVDVGIRVGGGNWPGLVSHFLLGSDFSPMLSPALAASVGGIREPADLLKLPFINPRDPWWTIWFEAAGVDASKSLGQRPRSVLGSQSFEGRAAVAGVGVGILTCSLFSTELADGSLTQPFDLVADDGWPFWLVYEERRRDVPKIKAFREWILRRTGQAA